MATGSHGIIDTLMQDAFATARAIEVGGWQNIDAQMRGLEELMRRADPAVSPDDATANANLRIASYNWMACGFPRITMGHKHAALLMCTHVPIDIVDVIPLPWHAFLVDVPSGLGVAPKRPEGDAPGRVDHALVWRSGDDDATCYLLNGLYGCVEGVLNIKLALGPSSKADAAATMLARMILGACIEISEHRPSPTCLPTSAAPIKRNRRGEPETETYVLRRDVQVDCRPAVREFCAGSGRGVSVRVMVRGHWKYQPHGKGRADRKFIRIDPYWRGPDDGPVALRSHVLGASEE